MKSHHEVEVTYAPAEDTVVPEWPTGEGFEGTGRAGLPRWSLVAEVATSIPGYTGVRPDDCATLAQTLRMNGYSTGMFGKTSDCCARGQLASPHGWR